MKILILFQILIILFMSGCKSDNPTNNNNNQTPTYGPKDPSFENGTDWQYSSSAARRSNEPGTFMPTNGVYYLLIYGNTSGEYCYQDNVDFSHSNKLIFDWESVGGQNCGGPDDYLIETITFSSNGTVTLWTKSFNWGSHNEKSSDTVNLPSLPDPGRLNFIARMEGSYACTGFKIDNIRVK